MIQKNPSVFRKCVLYSGKNRLTPYTSILSLIFLRMRLCVFVPSLQINTSLQPLWIKFGMMVEDLPGKGLGTSSSIPSKLYTPEEQCIFLLLQDHLSQHIDTLVFDRAQKNKEKTFIIGERLSASKEGILTYQPVPVELTGVCKFSHWQSPLRLV